MNTFTGTLRDGDQVIAQPVQGLYRIEKSDAAGQYRGYFWIPRGDAVKLATKGRTFCLAIEQGPTLEVDVEVSELAYPTTSAHAGFVSHGRARSE
jgi:hypothetical protein